MSDPYKNINVTKYDKNDPRYLKVSESEITRSQNKHSDEQIVYKNKEVKKKLLLFARIMQILSTKFSSPNSDDISHLPAGEQDFYCALSTFAEKLHSLSEQDKSADIHFINSLSASWDMVKQLTNRRKKLKKPPIYLNTLTQVIENITSFGEKDGASFGYYLTEHKNIDWFPIPYLNMLRSLYDNATVNKEHSILYTWQMELKEVIKQLLNPE